MGLLNLPQVSRCLSRCLAVEALALPFHLTSVIACQPGRLGKVTPIKPKGWFGK